MRGCLLLDRDGVINEDTGYVHRAEDFRFVPGIFEVCAHFAGRGFPIAVVTNQAGVAHGYFGEGDYFRLTGWMLGRFAERGIGIAAVFHDFTHPEAKWERHRAPSGRRKPEPGMLLEAFDLLDVEAGDSVLVGDKDSDVEAGLKSGVGRIYKLDNPRYPSRWMVDEGAVRVVSRLGAIIEREAAE